MSPPRETKKQQEWSESDRAALDDFIKEREREKWLSERRAMFLASAKGVFQWVTAAALAWAVLRDLGGVVWKWLKAALGVG